MTFGCDHIETAEPAYSLPFFLHFLALIDLMHESIPFFLGDFKPRGILVLQLGPSHRFGVPAENNVGSSAGHIRCDGHRFGAPCLSDDFCLSLVLFGIEHFVFDTAHVE